DGALAIGAERGDEQCYPSADIRRRHGDAVQLLVAVEADNSSAVRVAQDNLGAHVDELVHEEQARLKHLLVNEHRALGLRGYHEDNAQQV
nr:hypothetical protein [Tanacetum cinerariifolium]